MKSTGDLNWCDLEMEPFLEWRLAQTEETTYGSAEGRRTTMAGGCHSKEEVQRIQIPWLNLPDVHCDGQIRPNASTTSTFLGPAVEVGMDLVRQAERGRYMVRELMTEVGEILVYWELAVE